MSGGDPAVEVRNRASRFDALAGRGGDEVKVAVDVQHGQVGPLRTRGDQQIRDARAVLSPVGEQGLHQWHGLSGGAASVDGPGTGRATRMRDHAQMVLGRAERDRLLAVWKQTWPQSRPAADELKGLFPDRWVRFHSLPGSKRYADTEDEYEVLLGRHHAVLLELAGPSYGASDALVLTMSWSSTERPARRARAVSAAAPGAKHWTSFVYDDSEPEAVIWWHAYLGRLPLTRDGLNPLLRAVADDQTWGVVIAPDDLGWLYHPYDGGADVLLPSAERRDELAKAHRDWLSGHPHGL